MPMRGFASSSSIFKEGDKIFVIKTDLIDIFSEDFIRRLKRLLISLNKYPESAGVRVVLYIPMFFNIRENSFKEDDDSVAEKNKCIQLFNDDDQDLLFIDLKIEKDEEVTLDNFVQRVTELIKEVVYVN